MVLLATNSLIVEKKTIVESNLEVIYISGNMTLSTRTSMDALGLDEFKRGAHAEIEMKSYSVVSTDCTTCVSNPVGLQLNGTVVITELERMSGGLGRIEGILNITHLREYLTNGLVQSEWLTIDWDAGSASTYWDIHLIHDPPRWDTKDRYQASFVPAQDGSMSRTGPWIFVHDMLEHATNVEGCFPDSFMCDESTAHDYNLTATLGRTSEPIKIAHPSPWRLLQGMPETNATPSGMEEIRDAIGVVKIRNRSSSWCPLNDAGIVSSTTWDVITPSLISLAPMATTLDALGLPSSTFIPVGGTWTETDLGESNCGVLLDENNSLRLGIYTTK